MDLYDGFYEEFLEVRKSKMYAAKIMYNIMQSVSPGVQKVCRYALRLQLQKSLFLEV